MNCFVGMLLVIMMAGTVNLTQLALFFPSRALISSRYRRIQRFFHHHKLDYNEVARFIMKLFGFMNTDYYLSLDRTNWKWGNYWGVLDKAKPKKKLSATQKKRNKKHSSVRAKVEHPFRIIKCQFGYRKTRYRGLKKNAAQVFSLMALANLYQARHQIMMQAG